MIVFVVGMRINSKKSSSSDSRRMQGVDSIDTDIVTVLIFLVPISLHPKLEDA